MDSQNIHFKRNIKEIEKLHYLGKKRRRKKMKFKKKLELNKITVANLNSQELVRINAGAVGGSGIWTECYTECDSCVSICHTRCKDECLSDKTLCCSPE